MWIKPLPKDYFNRNSSFYNEVFLWQTDNVYVMDNHKSALWCWLQTCNSTKSYNFMHIDRHYDLLDNFSNDDLVAVIEDNHIGFDDFSNLMDSKGQHKVIRCDNYIRAGYYIHPRWFHANVFLTQGEGNSNRNCFGHEPIPIIDKNPLFLEWWIQQYIGEHSRCLEGFNGNDFKLHWIVNIDLDVLFTGYSGIQLFSDDYIRHIAELLQKNMKRIDVLTIAISPDWLGSGSLFDKWEKGIRILRIMSEKMNSLKGFLVEVDKVKS